MRGVEAPFQLLVSVFAMGLVLMLAYYVLNQGVKERCEDLWVSNITNLGLTIQQISEAAPPSSRVVSMDLRCGEFRYAVLKVQELDGKNLCGLICGEYVDRCYAVGVEIHGVKKNEIIFSTRECLRISPYTYYKLGDDCPAGYQGVGKELKRGLEVSKPVVHFLVRKTERGTSVCMGG